MGVPMVLACGPGGAGFGIAVLILLGFKLLLLSSPFLLMFAVRALYRRAMGADERAELRAERRAQAVIPQVR